MSKTKCAGAHPNRILEGYTSSMESAILTTLVLGAACRCSENIGRMLENDVCLCRRSFAREARPSTV